MSIALRFAVVALAFVALCLPHALTDAAAMEVEEPDDIKLLAQLAIEVESAGGNSQKLGWRVFDDTGVDVFPRLKTYEYADGLHTEAQMIADRDFLGALERGSKVFIWTTQCPCLFGADSTGREACSVLLPRFVAANPRKSFVVGFKSLKLGQVEYGKLGLKGDDEAAKAIRDQEIIRLTRASWGRIANGKVYQFELKKRQKAKKKYLSLEEVTTVFDPEAFVEVEATVESIRARILRRLTASVSQDPVQPTAGTPGNAKAQEDVVPNHKKILQQAMDKGKSHPLSFVLGKEDGSVVGAPVAGVAVPKPLPADVTYIAFFANPLKEAQLADFVRVANENPKHKVNVIFQSTSPIDLLIGTTLEQLIKSKPAQPNLRFFTLVGSTKIPHRIWPPKTQTPTAPAAAAAPGAAPAPKPTPKK